METTETPLNLPLISLIYKGRKYALIKKYALNKHLHLLTRLHSTSIKIISNETVSRDGGAKITQTRIVASGRIRMIIQGAPYIFSQ